MRVGVLGGGQLGRMLALAGVPMGVRFTFLDPAPEACAFEVGERIVAAYDDAAALDALAAACDVVTYEFESVPAASAARLAHLVPVRPSAASLAATGDRLAEKRLFAELSVDAAPFAAVDGPGDLAAAVAAVPPPAVLKARRLGYDGKGQAAVDRPDDAARAWAAIGEVPAILERRIAFTRELSVVTVRGLDGHQETYPAVENVHRDGILRTTVAPAPGLAETVALRARDVARLVAGRLDHVGALTIELFERDGELLANELAPRVHNSGHWTIEGARTGQFENHVRAICGLPLGPAHAVGAAAMVNLVGELPDPAAALAVHAAHLHVYGKAVRPGRKVGHVTVTAPTHAGLAEPLRRIRALLA